MYIFFIKIHFTHAVKVKVYQLHMTEALHNFSFLFFSYSHWVLVNCLLHYAKSQHVTRIAGEKRTVFYLLFPANMIITHSKCQIYTHTSLVHVLCLHHPRNVCSCIIRSNTWPPSHYPKPNIYQFFFISTHSQCFTKGGIACLSCIFRTFICLVYYYYFFGWFILLRI